MKQRFGDTNGYAKAVVGVLRGAPETLGIKPEDVDSTYLSVDSADDPTTPGALTIDLYVSSESVAVISSWPATARSSRSGTPVDARAFGLR